MTLARMHRISEADILAALQRRGLRVQRELEQYRCVHAADPDRRVYWRRSVRGFPGVIDFSGIKLAHPCVTPVHDNGHVTGRIDCRVVDRAAALAAVERALDMLLTR